MILENMPSIPHPNATIYYAVDAELSGGAKVETNNKGTEKGYVGGYYDSGTACTTFTVKVTGSGEYFISLRYAAGAAGNCSTDRTVGLAVNGESTINVPFNSMGATWDIWSENIQKVSLKAGINTIAYKSITDNDNSDCINIDKLSIWSYCTNPSLDTIVFEVNNYNVSRKYTIKTVIYEVDTNGIQLPCSFVVKYSSSDTSVAVVDENTGIITGAKEGTARITAQGKGLTAVTTITVLANPTISVDCAAVTRPVNSSTFGYILTPNYDVPNSRMTLLGPLLNRDTIPAQNFQAIGDLDGSYYAIEGSILPRCLEAYRRAKSVGYKWYMLLGMNPSWATSNGAPLESFKNKDTKSDIQQEHFKQYIKDVLQYFKDNGAKPDFADLTNEYWTGSEKTFKGNWEAVREVYPDFIPVVGPGAVGYAGIPDYYIPYASENNITVEGPCFHEFWVNDKYVTLSQLERWKNTIADYQDKYPEANGKYIIWEENNAGSKDATDWTRSMANVIRTGVDQNIKGCLEARNANGMSDLLTTNVIEKNPAARRPIWWVYYMFGQMSGTYMDITTDLTEDFTAAACTDANETKIIFAKNDCEGLVNIKLSNQPYVGEKIKADFYKIVSSENNGLEYQYSIAPKSVDSFNLTMGNVGANESWMAVIKKVKAAPSFFCPIAPDDGAAVEAMPTLTWSTAQDAKSYTVKLSVNKDMYNPIINEASIIGTSYTVTTELSMNEKYYWSVTAVNEYGITTAVNNTVYSFIVLESINIPGQFGPYLPSVNASNESATPEFKWSVAYNAASYRLVVSKNANMSNPAINESNITILRDTGMYGPQAQGYYKPKKQLEYDTTYYWIVYAVNSYGERSMNGSLHYFTTKAEGDSPIDFSLITPARSEVGVSARAVLSWEASKNAFFYKLEVSANSNMSKPVILRDRMIYNRYTVEPNMLEPNTTYYWRVTSYTKDLQYSKEASQGIWSFTTEVVPCSPLLYAEKGRNGKVKLWFHYSKGATSYKIKYGTKFGDYSATIDEVKASPFEVTALTNGTKYYFAVVAVNENGESSTWNERTATPQQEYIES